mgnify:FL=1
MQPWNLTHCFAIYLIDLCSSLSPYHLLYRVHMLNLVPTLCALLIIPSSSLSIFHTISHPLTCGMMARRVIPSTLCYSLCFMDLESDTPPFI